jgi:hypothetical protein
LTATADIWGGGCTEKGTLRRTLKPKLCLMLVGVVHALLLSDWREPFVCSFRCIVGSVEWKMLAICNIKPLILHQARPFDRRVDIPHMHIAKDDLFALVWAR